MADSTVKVNFVGDESDLKRAAKGASSAIDDVDTKAKSSGKALATGLAAVGGLTAITAGLSSASKAAAEDEAAQVSLAQTLKNVTGATKDQVAGVEQFISKTQNATGVLDDELRPAFDTLIRGTGDITKSQKLMSLAMDISAGTGNDLASVTDALAKAANGNTKSLKAMNPALAALIKDGASTDEVFAALGQTFEGQAAAKAATTSGQMAILKARMADLQEEIGGKVNVAVLAMAGFIQDKLIPAVSSIVDWMKQHKEIVIGVAAAIGTVLVAAFVSWAISAAAAAAATLLALAPIIAITAAIALLVAGVIYAYTHWQWFHDIVDSVAAVITDTVIPAFQSIWSFIANYIIPIVVAIITKFIEFEMKVAEVYLSIIRTIGDLIGWIASLVAKVAGIGKDIWDGLKNGLSEAIDWILKKLDTLLGPLDEILSKASSIGSTFGLGGGHSLADITKQNGTQGQQNSTSVTAILTVDGSVITKSQIDQNRKYD